MDKIKVDLTIETTSAIYVRNYMDDLFSLLDNEREVIAVIDKNVDEVYGKFIDYRKIIIDVSEEKKTTTTVEYVIGELLAYEATKNCLLIGIGGGVTTDLVGFVASIFKRGIRFAFVPTSLIGQIDASIGGKSGVNFMGYKNVIGVINQPEFSYVNISLLKSLPEWEFASGISEMLKIFIIGDQEAYEKAVNLFGNKRIFHENDFYGEEFSAFMYLVVRAIEIKCSIVKDDVNEKGVRKKLNLGHTFGHAIEKCEIAEEVAHHGEAVSVGMVIAAKISEKLRYLPHGIAQRIKADLDSIGLPTESPVPEHKLITTIRNDKKREDNSINFVFINKIGSVQVEKITIEKLEKIAYDLR